jgi:hypothetical protein
LLVKATYFQAQNSLLFSPKSVRFARGFTFRNLRKFLIFGIISIGERQRLVVVHERLENGASFIKVWQLRGVD